MKDTRKVTVVVPTKNRAIALSGLLSSLYNQSLSNFDVIIALNGEESWHPHLDKVVTTLKLRGINVIVYECIGMTFSELHDYMLNKSQTEYICRLDDDHVPNSDYLSILLNTIERDQSIGAVGGIVIHPDIPGHNFSNEEFIDALYKAQSKGIINTILQLRHHPTSELLKVPDIYSTFMARVEVIKKVGGIAVCYHSSSYREETDLTLRLTFAGYTQYIAPEATVMHIRSGDGGERQSTEQWNHLRSTNEKLFKQRLKSWCKNSTEYFKPLWKEAISNT